MASSPGPTAPLKGCVTFSWLVNPSVPHLLISEMELAMITPDLVIKHLLTTRYLVVPDNIMPALLLSFFPC